MRQGRDEEEEDDRAGEDDGGDGAQETGPHINAISVSPLPSVSPAVIQSSSVPDFAESPLLPPFHP